MNHEHQVQSRVIRKIVIIGHARFNQLIQNWFLATPNELEVQVLHIEHGSLIMSQDPSSQLCISSSRVSDLNLEQQHRSEQWLANADLVIDTISGDTATKMWVTEWIARYTASAIPVLTSILHHTATEISSWAKHTESFIGFHPLHFNDFKLLELAPALQTQPEVVQYMIQLFTEWGKKVEVIQDQVGGVFPRILALIINEASQVLAEGVAQAESIDVAMKKGTNYPYGPLEWADLIGLEHILWILDGLYREYGDDRYRASTLLKKKIYAGQLGVETKQGFYNYVT